MADEPGHSIYGEGASLSSRPEHESGIYTPTDSLKISAQLQELENKLFQQLPSADEPKRVAIDIGESVERASKQPSVDLNQAKPGDVLALILPAPGSEKSNLTYLKITATPEPDYLRPTNWAGTTQAKAVEFDPAHPLPPEIHDPEGEFTLQGASFGGSSIQVSQITPGLRLNCITPENKTVLVGPVQAAFLLRPDTQDNFEIVDTHLPPEVSPERRETVDMLDRVFADLDMRYFLPALANLDPGQDYFLAEWKINPPETPYQVTIDASGDVATWRYESRLSRTITIYDSDQSRLITIRRHQQFNNPAYNYHIQIFPDVPEPPEWWINIPSTTKREFGYNYGTSTVNNSFYAASFDPEDAAGGTIFIVKPDGQIFQQVDPHHPQAEGIVAQLGDNSLLISKGDQLIVDIPDDFTPELRDILKATLGRDKSSFYRTR